TDTSDCSPVAHINTASIVSTCDTTYAFSTPYHPNLVYQWNLNGNAIAGADSAYYVAIQSGTYSVTVANFINACNNTSDTVQLTLGIIVQPTITGLDTLYCSNAATVTLSGFPAGGTFSGNGINGNTFNAQTAGVGSHTITYQYQLNGCNASTQLSTTVSTCAGINENQSANLTVIPNPNNGSFNIRFNQNQTETITVRVVDASGKTIYKQQHQVNAGTVNLPLQIQTKAGVYTLQIQNKAGKQQLPFIIE
ncbi:MAG TPA: T9SS type A sorting domain-containing protein, partial [Bacteroidia bacterium]|nr:T9SS type A sorting domain-containing protein [Bacteroidia bacterium]